MKIINSVREQQVICQELINDKNKISYDKKRGHDIFGNNTLLRNIGVKKFKSAKQALLEYKK